jgi:hypothetical protein
MIKIQFEIFVITQLIRFKTSARKTFFDKNVNIWIDHFKPKSTSRWRGCFFIFSITKSQKSLPAKYITFTATSKEVWVKRGNSRGEIPEGSTEEDIREIS